MTNATLIQRLLNAARSGARRALPPCLRIRLRKHVPWLRTLGRPAHSPAGDYASKLQREAGYWGRQVGRQAADMAWLEHPLINSLYMSKRRIAGTDWPDWLKTYFAGPAGHVVELGSGTGHNGRHMLDIGAARSLTGYDISDERLDEARRKAADRHLAATYVKQDANTLLLEPNTCDLVFCRKSFHHFVALEHIADQVAASLLPLGLFILEEYVGPSIFQYSDEQLRLVKDLLTLLPERYRRMVDGVSIKRVHERPDIADVQNASPFEAIRSADIVPLFREELTVLYEIPLGGTIQRLLYDGILHNFKPGDEQANGIIRAIDNIETRLIAARALPSDVMLLVGTKKLAD